MVRPVTIILYHNTAANQVNTVKYIADNPLGFFEGMLYSRFEAVKKNPLLIDPFRNSVYSEYSAFAEKKKEVGLFNALSYKAGEGFFLIAEAGISSYVSKGISAKFKTPTGGKNPLLDEPSINKNNFKLNKNAKPATNKVVNNPKDTFSGILKDETGSVRLGGKGNAGSGVNRVGKSGAISHPVVDSPRVGSGLKNDPFHDISDIIDNYAKDAKRFDLPNKKGHIDDLYQIEGSIVKYKTNFNKVKNNAPEMVQTKEIIDGVFEWVVDPTISGVTHRTFIPGGKVSGKINQWGVVK